MKTFLISDTHFGHNNVYKFTDDRTGELLRPWAKDATEGDEILVDNWNRVVGKNDRVYHLGDVAIPRRGLQVLARLNGRKILVKGNHDIFKKEDYLPYFDDIRGSHKLDSFILSHIPIHPESLARWADGNIHGHLHSKIVRRRTWYGMEVPDKRYINVSVEQINATPIDFEEIRSWKKHS